MRPAEKGPWRKGNRQAAKGEVRVYDCLPGHNHTGVCPRCGETETEDEKIDRLAWAVLAEAAKTYGAAVYQVHPAGGDR